MQNVTNRKNIKMEQTTYCPECKFYSIVYEFNLKSDCVDIKIHKCKDCGFQIQDIDDLTRAMDINKNY